MSFIFILAFELYIAAVPVVYMALGVMILMRANPLQGPATFWARCHTEPKSLDFQGPPLPMALVMDFPAFEAVYKGVLFRCT